MISNLWEKVVEYAKSVNRETINVGSGEVLKMPKKEWQLISCPCCDGKAKFEVMRYYRDVILKIKVQCKQCGLSTKEVETSVNYSAKEVAAEMWNQRKGMKDGI